jgi:hypothetical protein
MPAPVKNWLNRLAKLALFWTLIQAVFGLWVVLKLRADYLRCETDLPCTNHQFVKEWEPRRAYVSLAWGQVIQPLGSALLLGFLRKSRHRAVHVLKAVGIGVVMAAVAGGAVMLIYLYYPRPVRWDFDLTGALVFGYYFILPILPLASALLGGIACGLMHWKMLSEKTL